MSSDRRRDDARRVVDDVRASMPGALRLGAIDLSGSLEQALLLALRRGRERDESSVLLHAVARIARVAAVSRLRSRRGSASVLVLAQVPIHLTLFADVGAELARRGLTTLAIDVDRAGPGADERLRSSFSLRSAPALLRHSMLVARHRAALPAAGDGKRQMYIAAREILPRIALMAAQLDAVVSRTRPACMVTFNEVGIWSRLAPAVARARGVPSVDLPHAEAADEEAIEGMPHDAIGVYGPSSADLMVRAGIPPERVHRVGTLRYDRLVNGSRTSADSSASSRILYASQPERAGIAQLSRHAKRHVYAAALATAAVAAPADLVVVAHPTERYDELTALMAEVDVPPGVRAVRASEGLHELLGDARLLVTAFSQSVFDAAIAGVPAIMVNPSAEPSPVTYAQEGFAVEVRDAAEAGAAAAHLLVPANRDAAIERARHALVRRFGPVDGRAHLRAADLIQTVIRRAEARPAIGRHLSGAVRQ